MSNKQTAVDWYENQIFNLHILLEKKEISIGEYAVKRVELFKQAKELEKQQRIEDMSKMQIIDDVDSDGNVTFIFNNIEEYYKETYEQ